MFIAVQNVDVLRWTQVRLVTLYRVITANTLIISSYYDTF